MQDGLEIIPIFFAVDNGYIPFLAVTLQSLIDNSSDKYHYSIIVLHVNVTSENKNAILKYQRKNVDIEFLTTPYDYEAIKEVDKYVNAYKIGSGDITWTEFLDKISKLNKPILLATGASTMDDVNRAVNIIAKNTSDIVLMQCNTNYTADLENMKHVNLRVLNTFKEMYPDIILGLSDHTFGHSAVLGAVAYGARVIEKHFTDNNNRIGPDHKFAMNPKTWKEMVARTRELEYALGDGIKKIEENEKDTIIVQRRSIRLKRNLKKGDLITLDDIEMLRPAPVNAYLPYEYDEILNKILKYDKEKGDCIYKGDLNE